jgi:hypothetical protein
VEEQMNVQGLSAGVRPGGQLVRLLGVGLACAAMFCVIPASQAMAASSQVVTIPPECQVLASSGRAPVARPARAQTPIAANFTEFCAQLRVAAPRANAFYNKYYSASKRRRIRRAISSVARRYATSGPVAASVGRTTLIGLGIGQGVPVGLSLNDIKAFGKKALKKVKTVVGGVIKVVPQARLGKCALFAALGAAVAYGAGGDLTEVLVAAAGGCIGTIADDIYDAAGKLPKPK